MSTTSEENHAHQSKEKNIQPLREDLVNEIGLNYDKKNYSLYR